MKHIALLGDSIFDNQAYVNGGKDVLAHLNSMLPPGYSAMLLAVDGSITTNVAEQLARLPETATHLVVSVGGNDGLARVDIVQKPSMSVGASLDELAALRSEFRENYTQMLNALSRKSKPFAVCTVYDPRFPDPVMQRLATTALNLFNDCIIREAAFRGLPVLDLRLICSEAGDYANAIEPGVAGGRKIATSILKLVEHHNFSEARTAIFW
jgi:hypothetical protein